MPITSTPLQSQTEVKNFFWDKNFETWLNLLDVLFSSHAVSVSSNSAEIGIAACPSANGWELIVGNYNLIHLYSLQLQPFNLPFILTLQNVDYVHRIMLAHAQCHTRPQATTANNYSTSGERKKCRKRCQDVYKETIVANMLPEKATAWESAASRVFSKSGGPGDRISIFQIPLLTLRLHVSAPCRCLDPWWENARHWVRPMCRRHAWQSNDRHPPEWQVLRKWHPNTSWGSKVTGVQLGIGDYGDE